MSSRTPLRNQIRGTIQRRNPAASVTRGFNQLESVHLRSQRNLSAPISKLPVEVMSKIFKLIQEDENREDWYWIKVTHVCRSWRDIALGTQTLWTTLLTGCHVNAMQTKAFLDRSGTSQIEVIHCSNTPPDGSRISNLHLALTQLSRIRALYIYETTILESLSLERYLTNRAPVLKTFVFAYPIGFNPSALFGNNAPQLQNLHMRFDTGSWSHLPIVSGLKSLVLGSTDVHATLADILAILRTNPSLLRLHLSAIAPPRTSSLLEERAALSPIKLFFVHQLNFSMEYTLLCRVLKCIRFLHNVHWNISTNNYPLNGPTDIIPSILDRNVPCNVLNLTLDTGCLRIETDPGNFVSQRKNGLPVNSCLEYVWVDSGGISDIGKVFGLIKRIIANRFWSRASKVVVGIFTGFNFAISPLNAMIWINFFALLPKVQKLRVSTLDGGTMNYTSTVTESHYGLLDAMATVFSHEDGSSGIVCPLLTELCLTGLDLHHHLRKLIEVLSFRANNGRQLRLLTLHNCSNVTDYVKSLILQYGCAKELEVTGGIHEDDDSESESESGSESESESEE